MKGVRLDMGQIEVMDEAMAAVIRAKTPAQRIAIAFAIWESVRTMLMSHLASSHPDWSRGEVEREVARRMSRGAA